MKSSHLCLLAMLLVMGGCGQSDNLPSQAVGESGLDIGSLPVEKESAPSVVVSAFLDALRAGDNMVAEQLLTTTAREQTAAHDLPVQAPGSPTATYLIGDTTHIEDGVQVSSRWTERSPEGQPIVYDIDWILREQAEGWRVVGMSTSLTPNGDLVHINFEDVADMLQKWDQADAELVHLEEEAAALQAQGRSAPRR